VTRKATAVGIPIAISTVIPIVIPATLLFSGVGWRTGGLPVAAATGTNDARARLLGRNRDEAAET